VKRGSGGVPHCAETLCAFGNMPGGGTIIVGLDEADGFAAVGVASVAEMEAGIAAQARTAVQPPVAVTFQPAQIDGADVVVASVAGLPSHQRPCRTSGKAYLRQSDGDYVMSEQEVQQTLALRNRPRYDATIVDGASTADLDVPLVRSYLTEVRSSSRRLADLPDDEILQRKGVRRGEALTTGGAYALGGFPQEFEPSLSITAAVQVPREAGARTRDLQHMDGPLPEMLSQAMEWVRRNTRTTIWVGDDGRARDSAEIPLVAVRELVANALVHRDLGPHTRGKRVEIRLLDDKLVISNPGGLYGISSDQLGEPEGKSAVNEFLYDICKYTRTSEGDRVIEGEGGGIREVEASLRAAGLAAPHFIDRGISFTVIVPRHALLPLDDVAWLAVNDPKHQLSPMEGQILSSMRHGQVWANSTVRAEFPGLDSREAQRTLAHLVDLDFAEAVGQGRGRQYKLHPRWQTATVPRQPKVSVGAPDVATDQDPLPVREPRSDPDEGRRRVGHDRRDRSTPARQAVLEALRNGPLTLRSMVDDTGLTVSTVRYALRGLIAEQLVVVNGGWGVKGTTYQRARPPGR
jgi:ATP-dependent DNA helicase RecG